MNTAYQKIIVSNDSDRRDLFITAATRVGTTARNIEKDFWVCWTLDVLFHRLEAGGPRLLSKGYGLISRFSEDIDITVFRSDIGEEASVQQLEELSKKKRTQRLDSIKSACQTFINGKLRDELATHAKKTMEAAGKNPEMLRIVPDEQDTDRQSLLIHYPSVVETSEYVLPRIKIESGAKSAVDPHEDATIVPYLVPDLPAGNALTVAGVTTIRPERTFLDKILILHGMTCYYDAKGALRGDGRMSRHYYDVHKL